MGREIALLRFARNDKSAEKVSLFGALTTTLFSASVPARNYVRSYRPANFNAE